MTHTLKFAHWLARLRTAVVVTVLTAAVFGCSNDADLLTPDTSTPPETPGTGVTEVTQLDDEGVLTAITFRGGIPFGTFAQPTGSYGSPFNGAMANIWPKFLLDQLRQIKARGGRVVLMFAGSELHYKNRRGNFDLGKWKARVDRFKHVNFNSYVNDGTIIGHYLIDEPQDPENWRGRPISQATVEEMARYSKRLWPNMVTIVRAPPTWLVKWKGSYRALDAAWAQYLARFGSPRSYIQPNIAAAQKKGLALITGLNLLHGGNPKKTPMNAREVVQYGSALLESSYPCAFISWKYNASFLRSPGMKAAMETLRRKAQSRGTKSCRGS
jgi:hypothetical protein